jgi:hypothetical protein
VAYRHHDTTVSRGSQLTRNPWSELENHRERFWLFFGKQKDVNNPWFVSPASLVSEVRLTKTRFTDKIANFHCLYSLRKDRNGNIFKM